MPTAGSQISAPLGKGSWAKLKPRNWPSCGDSRLQGSPLMVTGRTLPPPTLMLMVLSGGVMPSAHFCIVSRTSSVVVMPFEKLIQRSHMPRAEGASKPPTTLELVLTVSGRAWQPMALSAQVAGAKLTAWPMSPRMPLPSLSVKKSEKPWFALALSVSVGRRAGDGG